MIDVPLTNLVRHVYRRVNERRLIGLASEAGFWLSLALIPLAAVAAMMVAGFAMRDDSALGPLLGAVPDTARSFVVRELGQLAAFRGGKVAPAAALVFVWLASSGIHGLFDAFEACTGAPERPWWKKRVLALCSCMALSIGVALIAVIGEGWDRFYMALGAPGSGADLGVMGRTEIAVRSLLGLTLDLLMLIGLYRIGIPRCDKCPKRVLPGAVVALVLQVILGLGYALFIHTLGDSSAYLAGLAAVAIMMTTCFLFCLSLLLGVAVNVALDELSPRHHRQELSRDRLASKIRRAPPLLRHAGAGLRWVLGRGETRPGPAPSARGSIPR